MLAWSRGRGMESLSTAEEGALSSTVYMVQSLYCHTWVAEELDKGSSLS